MIFQQRNASSLGAFTCAESADIDNVKTDTTSQTALITPVGGAAVIDFVPATPGTYNVFVLHQHTADANEGATLTVRRFANNNFTGLVDTQVRPLVTTYTAVGKIDKPQERKQTLVMFQADSPLRILSEDSISSVRFSAAGHTAPFEIGMLGVFEGYKTKAGHVSGNIRDVTTQAATQARTITTHNGGVSSIHKTIIRDYSYSLVNMSTQERETLLDIAEGVNVTFPFLFVPLPDQYLRGETYSNVHEEGGIVRLTAPVRFDSSSVLSGTPEDKHKAQSISLRRWV